MVQLDPGPNRGRPRLECPGDRGHGGPLGQGEHPRGSQHRHLAAADRGGGVGLVTGRRKAARRPGSSVMAQPYAAPPPPAINEAGSAIRRPMPTDGGLARWRWPPLEAPVQFTEDHADITDELQERCWNSP
jgi:hypothetical protein